MIITLLPDGPGFDTLLSQNEQPPETTRFLLELLHTPFDPQLSTSESCGKLNWPKPGEPAELLRWPVKVWQTETARVTLLTTFRTSPSDAGCMAETARSLTIAPLATS